MQKNTVVLIAFSLMGTMVVQEAPVEGAWAPPATEALFDAYVAAGIRVVRIPMRWDNHTDTTAPYSIDPVWMVCVMTAGVD